MSSIRRTTVLRAFGRLRPHVSVANGMSDPSCRANGMGGQIEGGRVSTAGNAM